MQDSPFAGLTPVQRIQIREARAADKTRPSSADPATATGDRGVCPVCGRDFLLTKAGMVRHHGAKDDSWPPRRCDGAGQPPKGQ